MLLCAAHGRCHHLRSGAHPLVFGANLPGEAQQARAGVPVAQAGDGHRAVAAGDHRAQSVHGARGAGDLELRPRAGAVQAGAADARWADVRNTKIAQHDRGRERRAAPA